MTNEEAMSIVEPGTDAWRDIPGYNGISTRLLMWK